MANEFLVDFDILLDQILVDYSNLDSNPDTSVGTMTYVKGACLASMLWGLYRYQDYLSRQIFPDTADTDNLNRHGNVLGIPRASNDTDSTYLEKIINKLRNPPAGGNRNDWTNWTKLDSGNVQIATGPAGQVPYSPQTGGTLVISSMLSTVTTIESGSQFYIADGSQVYTLTSDATFSDSPVSGSGTLEFTPDILVSPVNGDVVRFVGDSYYTGSAKIITPNDDDGVEPGNVDVVIVPNEEDILDTPTGSALQTLIENNIEERRPVTANGYNVYQVQLLSQTIIISGVTGATAVQVKQMKEDIIAHTDTLAPGDKLVIAKLISICLDNGATNAVVNTPAEDVSPTNYQAVRVNGTPTIQTA